MLEDGLMFSEACGLLMGKYDSNLRTWASYGDYDRLKMVQQLIQCVWMSIQ